MPLSLALRPQAARVSRQCASPDAKHSAGALRAPRPARARQAQSLRVSASVDLSDALQLSNCKPLGKRILMVPDVAEQKTAGGILLPGSATKTTNTVIGEVVGVGEGVQGISVGQKVMISGYGGVEVDFDGRKAKFVNDDQILAVVA